MTLRARWVSIDNCVKVVRPPVTLQAPPECMNRKVIPIEYATSLGRGLWGYLFFFTGFTKKRKKIVNHTTFQLATAVILSFLIADSQVAAGKPTLSHISNNCRTRSHVKDSVKVHSTESNFLEGALLLL
jgi:hypothetical protein